VALNYCMRDHGGFEGNGQTLRLLSRLESFSNDAGANLSRRTLLGLLKYPLPHAAVANPAIRPSLMTGPTAVRLLDVKSCKPPKCYLDSEEDVVDWVLDPLSASDRTAFRRAWSGPANMPPRFINRSIAASWMWPTTLPMASTIWRMPSRWIWWARRISPRRCAIVAPLFWTR
jgi:dGTPase